MLGLTPQSIKRLHDSYDAAWVPAQMQEVMGLLISAQRCLWESEGCLNYFITQHELPFPSDESYAPVLKELVRQVDGKAPISMELNWKGTPASCRFSASLFLNKTMMNVASAFDRTINAWLRWLQDVDWNNDNADDIWVGSYVTSRVEVIRGIYKRFQWSEEIDRELTSVHEGFDKFHEIVGSSTMAAVVQNISTKLDGVSFDTVCDLENVVPGLIPFNSDACLAFVFSQVNSIKHRPKEKMVRKGNEVFPLCIIAAHALTRSMLFAENMIAATNQYWKK